MTQNGYSNFSFSIAINTYFRKNAESKDIAPSMAVGFTINHISAVILPVIGGLLWTINWRIPFLGGALLTLASLFFSQKVSDNRSDDELFTRQKAVASSL